MRDNIPLAEIVPAAFLLPAPGSQRDDQSRRSGRDRQYRVDHRAAPS
jgi:hypothetical protein